MNITKEHENAHIYYIYTVTSLKDIIVIYHLKPLSQNIKFNFVDLLIIKNVELPVNTI
jgi:hypothetical protein